MDSFGQKIQFRETRRGLSMSSVTFKLNESMYDYFVLDIRVQMVAGLKVAIFQLRSKVISYMTDMTLKIYYVSCKKRKHLSNFVACLWLYSTLFCLWNAEAKNIFNSFNIIEKYERVKRSGIGFKRSIVGFTK